MFGKISVDDAKIKSVRKVFAETLSARFPDPGQRHACRPAAPPEHDALEDEFALAEQNAGAVGRITRILRASLRTKAK
jgi:hypothetical protein